MLLSLLLVGLAIAQRSEWMDEFDPETAYLSFISVTQTETESNTTEIQLMDSDGSDDEETDVAPPPSPVPEGPRPGPPPPPPGPQGPHGRCGDWNNWEQAKCWWPDQSLDKLPPACTAIPTKPDWPSWMKKFVTAKAMEKYSMLMKEFNSRGSPPKCGFCARSFECRTRNTTSGGDFCPTKEIRPMFGVDCEDKMACEVTQEKGGCPPPLFLGGGRRERLQQMIKEDNHEGFAKELFRMQKSDSSRRQKRQASAFFDGPASFMPFSPSFDFPYDDGRKTAYVSQPQQTFRPRPFPPSFRGGPAAFDAALPAMGPFGPSEDLPSRFPRRPSGGMPRPYFRNLPSSDNTPFGPSPMPFSRNPYNYFKFPPSRGVPFSPFFQPSNDAAFPRRRSFQGLPRRFDKPFDPSNDAPFPSPSASRGVFGKPFLPFPGAPYLQRIAFGSSNDAPFLPLPPPGASPFPSPFGPIPPPPFTMPFAPFHPQGPPPFRPPFSMAPRFPMIWGPPMSFPGGIPPTPSRPFGPPPQHRFLLDLFHGTTCASTGKKCLCCCGHFIPNIENGKCEDLHQLLPGIDRMVDKIAQGPGAPPPPPSFKDIRQMKKKLRNPQMTF